MANPSQSSDPSVEEAAVSGQGGAAIPVLAADATNEQKDEHWFRHVYQGDRMPQLTLRAVLMGGLLGMLMSAANLYTTLSIGWAFGIAITSCVLSFVMWNAVVLMSRGKVSQMSMLENACMASTASAAGYSTGSTMATMFGALVLLKDVPEGTPLSSIKTWDVTEPWVVVVFTLCTGLLGVFLAIPMKRQQINHEQLPFPSGIAAAETLRSLYSQSVEAMHKAYMLVFGLASGLVIGFLRVGDDILDNVKFLKNLFLSIGFLRIPEKMNMHFFDRLYPASRLPAGFAFEPSALLIAAGMIVGMRTSVSLLVSSLLLYGVIGPKLADMDARQLDGGAQVVVAAYENAAAGKTDPKVIAKGAVDAIGKALAPLSLPAAAEGAAARGAVGGLDAIETAMSIKRVEAMIDAAAHGGLRTDWMELAAKRAAREAGEGPEAARAGAAITAASRLAEAKGGSAKPIAQAAEKARSDAQVATDKEAGEAVLSAILVAAEKEGVAAGPIKEAAVAASKVSKASPGRDGAAAALKAAVKLVYVDKESDPSAIERAAAAASGPANVSAAKKVSEATIAAVMKEASALAIDTQEVAKSADAAAARAESGEGVVRFEAAREVLMFEAFRVKADAAPILAAATKVEFTAEEKEKNLKDLKQAIVGRATGSAGVAGTAFANRGATRASEEAIADAKTKGLTYRKTKEAGDAAFEAGKYRNNIIFNWGGGEITLTRWSLWGGTAVMVFASLMSVALQWRSLVRAFVGVKSAGAAGSSMARDQFAADQKRIEVPGSWMIMGILPITIAMVWLQIQAFEVSWYAGLIAVAMSFVLSLVASRATGETDTTPIGAMGKVMQLLFAVLAPSNITANLASAGIAANSAIGSADLLTDLKTGYLLGANPRKQFIAQFVGVFFGTVAIVPIWYLMVPTRAKLETFALPSTRTWEAVARVLVKGVSELPPSAIWAIFIGATVGVVVPLIERLTPARYRGWLPSASGMGLAWVMPFQNAFSFFLGAVVVLVWGKVSKRTCDKYNVPLASGLIAGESLMAAGLAITATVAGLLAVS